MSQQIKGSHWKGPQLGDADSMGGALEDFPLGVFADTKYTRYFNDFQNQDVDYVTGTNGWTVSTITAGGAEIIEEAVTSTGILKLDCAGAHNGTVLQYDMGASKDNAPIGVTPTAATSGTAVETDALFVCRFRVPDFTNTAGFVGMAERHDAGTSDVLLTNNTTLTTSDTHAAFHWIDSDTAGQLRATVCGDAIADVVQSLDVLPTVLANDEWMEVAIRMRGTDKYSFFIKYGGSGRSTGADWTKVFSGQFAAADDWDTQMVISLGILGAATGDDLEVDYVQLLQRRDLIE